MKKLSINIYDSQRFVVFKCKISNGLSLVSLPFAFNVDNAPASIQLELINLQSNKLQKNQFSEKTILEFYAFLNPEIFKNILDYAQKYLTFFGSTYICEANFR